MTYYLSFICPAVILLIAIFFINNTLIDNIITFMITGNIRLGSNSMLDYFFYGFSKLPYVIEKTQYEFDIIVFYGGILGAIFTGYRFFKYLRPESGVFHSDFFELLQLLSPAP